MRIDRQAIIILLENKMETQEHAELINRIQSLIPSASIGMYDETNFQSDHENIVILIYPRMRELFVSMPITSTRRNKTIFTNIQALRFIRLMGFKLCYIGYQATTFKFKF